MTLTGAPTPPRGTCNVGIPVGPLPVPETPSRGRLLCHSPNLGRFSASEFTVAHSVNRRITEVRPKGVIDFAKVTSHLTGTRQGSPARIVHLQFARCYREREFPLVWLSS